MHAASATDPEPVLLTIPAAATLPVRNLAGLSRDEHEEWRQFLRADLGRLRVHPEGLGAWGVGLATDAQLDRGCLRFVDAVGPAAAVPFELELVSGSLGEDDRIDRNRLGSYSSPASGCPVVRLYVDRIRRCAKADPNCTQWALASVVLRHEIGHHVSRITKDELERYDSSQANPQTCRPETAAQLFAWLTSDAAGRELMERLDPRPGHGKGSPYAVFWHFLQFAEGKLPTRPSGSGASHAVRPGWHMAWQLSQSPKHAELVLPDAVHSNASLCESIEAQCRQLAVQIGNDSVWPIVETLGCELSRLVDCPSQTKVAIAFAKVSVGLCLHLTGHDSWPENYNYFVSKRLTNGLAICQQRQDLHRFWTVTSRADVDDVVDDL